MKRQISSLVVISIIVSLFSNVLAAAPVSPVIGDLYGTTGSYIFDLSQNISSNMTYSNGVLTYAPANNGYQYATLDIATQNTSRPIDTLWAKLSYDVMVSDYETCWSAGMVNYVNTSGMNVGGKDDAYGIFDILPIDEAGTDARIRQGAIGAGTWAPNRWTNYATYGDDEWNHIEYYADLGSDSALLTMKINGNIVKTNIDSTITDMAQFGNLHFGFKNACRGNVIKIKNVEYSWEENVTSTPTPTPTPTLTPSTGGTKHIVDFNSTKEVNPYNYGSADSVYGYDATAGEAYFQTTASRIQYKVLGQNFVEAGYDWYHLSYDIKTNNPSVIKNLGRIDASSDTSNPYSNTVFQILYDVNQKAYIAYGVNTDDPGVVLAVDFTNYHKLDVYLHNVDGKSTVYLFVDGTRVGSWRNGNFASRFGQFFIQTEEGQTVKTNLKNFYYEWDNEMLLPDEVPAEPVDDVTMSAIANKGAQKVVYIGGSITEGDGVNRWSTYLTDWLNTNVPGSSFTEINVGIGGTDSKLGLVRTQRDIVAYSPDIVFIEYAVNDRNNQATQSAKCMEGIIRQLMEMDKVPYVVGVGVVTNSYDANLYTRERNMSTLHKTIMKHYGLKYIDVATYMDDTYGAPAEANTERNALYFADQTHPNPTGHAFYAESIESEINSQTFQRPKAESAYCDYYKVSCKFVNASRANIITGDWTAYGEGDWNEANLARAGSGLKSSSPEASLTYYFSGSVLYIGSRFDKANGQFKVSVDGEERIVEGYYNGTNNQPVSEYKRLDLSDGFHTLVISPTGTKAEGSTGTSISIDYIIVDKDKNPDEDMSGFTINNIKINELHAGNLNDLKGSSASVSMRLNNYANVNYENVFVVAMVTDLNGRVYSKATTPFKSFVPGECVSLELSIDVPLSDLNLNLKLYTLQGDSWTPIAPVVAINGEG